MYDDRTLRRQVCAFAAANGFAAPGPDALTLLALGGSDRRFYRIPSRQTSCIAMVSPPPGNEQQAWYEINTLLQSCGIGVPRVFACDNTTHIMLVEDIGDESLYSRLHAAQKREEILDLYERVLELLAGLQVHATPRMGSCPCLYNRRFDYAAFRFETDYFVRSFLREYCAMEPPPGLDAEFHRLAEMLASEPTVFMHRDFQSQNIHIASGNLKIIDFQTATAGPAHYDLVSLLKDAYFVLQPDERELLLQHYFTTRSELGSPVDDPDDFTGTFHLCGLQRNMQALAAFSFLGTHKEKTHFYRHIPTALEYITEMLGMIEDYPCLGSTIEKICCRLATAPPLIGFPEPKNHL